MKFKQFLIESITAEQFKKFKDTHSTVTYYSNNGGNSKQEFNEKSGVLFKSGKICLTKNWNGICIGPKHGDTDFSPWNVDFPSDSWNLPAGGCVEMELMSFDDFSTVPNVNHLDFHTCQIESLKGIEKLNMLDSITFRISGPSEHIKKPGLLRLLKCDLRNVSVEQAWGSKLNTLLNELLKEKSDMVEAQSRLIDEGFEEFAKL